MSCGEFYTVWKQQCDIGTSSGDHLSHSVIAQSSLVNASAESIQFRVYSAGGKQKKNVAGAEFGNPSTGHTTLDSVVGVSSKSLHQKSTMHRLKMSYAITFPWPPMPPQAGNVSERVRPSDSCSKIFLPNNFGSNRTLIEH